MKLFNDKGSDKCKPKLAMTLQKYLQLHIK